MTLRRRLFWIRKRDSCNKNLAMLVDLIGPFRKQLPKSKINAKAVKHILVGHCTAELNDNTAAQINDLAARQVPQMAVIIRFVAVQAPEGSCCMIPKAGDHELCLTTPKNPVVHPLLCKQGPARVRTHKFMCSTLTRLLRKTGAHVDMERAIPQLYMLEADGTRITEAILDVVSSHPGGLCKFMVDVTIRAPHAARYEKADHIPGVAASAGESDKLEGHGLFVLPISLNELQGTEDHGLQCNNVLQ